MNTNMKESQFTGYFNRLNSDPMPARGPVDKTGYSIVDGKAVFPDHIKSVPDHVFQGGGHLVSAEIPEGVTSIGIESFGNCIDLERVVIPESVTSIGAYAFYNCVSLREIVFPEHLKEIGEGAFLGCLSLEQGN